MIVVDDNSKKCEKENLCKIVSTYKFHLYEMKNNVGAGACRNLALKKQKENGSFLLIRMIILYPICTK